MKKLFLFLIFNIHALFYTHLNAQICNRSFGDPVVNIDFGRGTSFFGPNSVMLLIMFIRLPRAQLMVVIPSVKALVITGCGILQEIILQMILMDT